GLSPLRNQADLNPFLISTYDIALRNAVLAAQLQPQQVIRLGELPTSKALRQWLQSLSAHHWIIDPTDQNLDPIHASSTHIRASVEAIAHRLATVADATGEMGRSPEGVAGPQQTYLKTWLAMEQALGQTIDRTMDSIQPLRESKVAWLLSQVLPPHTPLFIANSMPVRDVEMFWRPNTLRVQPYFNRGANGIDGTLSTALGMAQGQRGVLLTGDLSLLHDTNGFLMRPQFQGHLTIVLINNAGGGIFGMLPIAAYAETFETFFATPQAVDFAPLCQVYGVEHQVIESWAQLRACLNPLPEMGIRVLEVVCDRTLDAQWRKTHLAQLAADLEAVLE
ncbi:MAG TPA: thiamine pyrophosphate-dependent enzyme, partial [Stenomitos sp.]